MQRFVSFDGVEIAYHEWGKRDDTIPVVLHHGFIADSFANWVAPGIVDALLEAGRWVVGIDARGHGASAKPHDPKRYGESSMARDVSFLFDLVGSPQYDLVGYSMGGVVAAVTATRDFRIRRLVLSGVGGNLARQDGFNRAVLPAATLEAALLSEDPDEIATSPAAGARALADTLGADRKALASMVRSRNTGTIPFSQIAAETLVLVGREDNMSPQPELLTAAIPGARLMLVPGDHLSALRDPAYAPTLVEFIGKAPSPV
jgi:pimeloyl-ACP methyl ester carboxylesterase